MSLSSRMMQLTKYGMPRLSYTKSGWYCVIDMNTNASGVKFEIASDFTNVTPDSAVDQVTARVEATIKNIQRIGQ